MDCVRQHTKTVFLCDKTVHLVMDRKEPRMKSELKKVTQERMELERKTSKQRQVAELFYEENLMSLVVSEFTKNIRFTR